MSTVRGQVTLGLVRSVDLSSEHWLSRSKVKQTPVWSPARSSISSTSPVTPTPGLRSVTRAPHHVPVRPQGSQQLCSSSCQSRPAGSAQRCSSSRASLFTSRRAWLPLWPCRLSAAFIAGAPERGSTWTLGEDQGKVSRHFQPTPPSLSRSCSASIHPKASFGFTRTLWRATADFEQLRARQVTDGVYSSKVSRGPRAVLPPRFTFVQVRPSFLLPPARSDAARVPFTILPLVDRADS